MKVCQRCGDLRDCSETRRVSLNINESPSPKGLTEFEQIFVICNDCAESLLVNVGMFFANFSEEED